MARVKSNQHILPSKSEPIKIHSDGSCFWLSYGKGNDIKVVYEFCRQEAAFCHHYLEKQVYGLPADSDSGNGYFKECPLYLFVRIHLFIEASKPLDEIETPIIFDALFNHMADEEVFYWHSKALTDRKGMKAFRILFSHPYQIKENKTRE